MPVTIMQVPRVGGKVHGKSGESGIVTELLLVFASEYSHYTGAHGRFWGSRHSAPFRV